MKQYFILLSIFLFPAATIAQTIGGTVKDQNNDPLPYASIVIKGTTAGTQTSENGKFSMVLINQKLPLIALVSYVGYEPREFIVKDVSQNLDFKLSRAVVVSSGVTISASRLNEKTRQAPLTVETMDQIAIRETPAFNFYEGLGQLKGVDITSASLAFKIINTRGFNSTSPVRSLQIIDGVDNQAPGLNFSLGNFLGCPDLDVVKVDLVVGAASAYYGPNAFNGVISITSKDPFQAPGLSLSLKYGERNLFEGIMRWDQVIKNKSGKEKFAYKLNGYFLRANDWEASNLDPVYGSQDGKDNPGGYDAVNRYGDEFYFADDYSQSTRTYPGLNRFYRTGYLESDLVDYDTRNYKLSAAFHYKLSDSTRLIYASNFGSGTTVYQGDNRYSLKDILFFQNRIEIRRDNKFFLRAYATNENAGNSYDAYFTALLLERGAKSDVSWGTDYYNYYASHAVKQIQELPGYPAFQFPIPVWYTDSINYILMQNAGLISSFHSQSRLYADDSSLSVGEHAFYTPGTPEFDSAFNAITSKESFSEGGSKFLDRSALYDVHGEYTFTPKLLDVTVGSSFRMYRPDSRGTIFSDTAGRKIVNREFGVYTGFEKRIFKDALKLDATIRMDKNENFNYVFSPAASVVYLYKKQVFRISFSSAVRNPTLTDQYLFYNVGRARLVGNITGFDSLVTIPSLLDFLNTQNADTFSYFNVQPLRPEQVKTIEIGYRASLFKHVFIDAGYYYSWYRYFIGYKLGALLDYNSQYNSVTDFLVYRVAANTNDEVTTNGFSAGINYYFTSYFTVNANYSFNKLNRRGSSDPIIPAYNTPQNKFNLGFSGRNIDWQQLHLYHLGFSINYRWIQGFLYEGSPQFTGFVPTYGKLDFQINKEFPAIDMVLKIGASNALNNLKFEVYGGPYVGRLAYVNAVFDFGKK